MIEKGFCCCDSSNSLEQQIIYIPPTTDIWIVWTIQCQLANIEVVGGIRWASPCIEANIYVGAITQDPCPCLCVDDCISGNEALIS